MCHQTVGLTARHLEAGGIATLVIGSARDIIDEVGVPRFAFTDLPLGNPVGPAYDPDQQRRILRTALDFAAAAIQPRSSVILPVEWAGTSDWRETYMSTADAEGLRVAGIGRRQLQAERRSARAQSGS